MRNLVLGLFLLYFSSTHAAFVERDLASAGDSFLTLDTITGLEWLDVPLTQGESVNSVLSGFGGYANIGFRYATNAEIQDFFSNANNIVSFGDVLSSANWQGVLQIQNLTNQRISIEINPKNQRLSYNLTPFKTKA